MEVPTNGTDADLVERLLLCCVPCCVKVRVLLIPPIGKYEKN